MIAETLLKHAIDAVAIVFPHCKFLTMHHTDQISLVICIADIRKLH
jgi:hypothetical protein